MSAFYYRDDGRRALFNAGAVGKTLAGCLLCGARVVMVGVFCPTDDEARAAILRLRQHALHTGSMPALVYGLCRRHARDLDRAAPQVEAAILAAAGKVQVQ
ncbi:MAG: hypothetical protein Q7J25_10710 [Vicinamibacterales bacterium]|nr:hypothetical protein [Vicinamibacterales bacterium]